MALISMFISFHIHFSSHPLLTLSSSHPVIYLRKSFHPFRSMLGRSSQQKPTLFIPCLFLLQMEPMQLHIIAYSSDGRSAASAQAISQDVGCQLGSVGTLFIHGSFLAPGPG